MTPFHAAPRALVIILAEFCIGTQLIPSYEYANEYVLETPVAIHIDPFQNTPVHVLENRLYPVLFQVDPKFKE